MMDETGVLLFIVALLAGAALGWFLGSRPVAEWRARHAEAEAAAKEHAERVSRMAPELATMSERAARADDLAQALDRAREENARFASDHATLSERAGRVDSLAADLERLRADNLRFAAVHSALQERAERVEPMNAELIRLRAENTRFAAERAGFEEQKRLLEESREKLLKEFENTGAKVLGAAQEKFLATAAERLGHSEKASEEKLKALLSPVGETLKKYEERVESLESKRVADFGQLAGLIDSMRAGQEEVRREAQRLGNSLTNAPKARGRWGERALQNVLEQCGLAEHTDFHLEHSMDTDEGRLRPDAIVRVPGQKRLVIDAKVSLNAYQAAFESDRDDDKARHLGLHAKAMRNHVQTLGSKSYQSQFDDAPDYVVMFVPGEHFVAAALEADPELWDFAFRNKVLLATPTNLVAIARTVAQVWRQEKLAEEARAIGQMGAELYDRIATAAEHLKRVGGGLESAVSNYNKFVGSFERNVLSSGRRLKDKGIEIGKREIEAVPLVESAPRYTAGDAPEPEDGREAAE